MKSISYYILIYLFFISIDLNGQSSINGQVLDWRGTPLEGVEVIIDAPLLEYPRVQLTDEDGRYDYSNLPENIEYTVYARMEDTYSPKLTFFDFAMTQLQLLGSTSFQNPHQHIAADVTNDNRVNVSDLNKMRRIYLGIIEGQPTYDAWRYVDAGIEFSDPDNPFIDLDENSYRVKTTLLSNDKIINFTGIRMGDINTN